MHKAILFVTTISCMAFFVSCSPRGQSPVPTQTPASTPDTATSPGSTSSPSIPLDSTTGHGTADSGGGNTFMGKPLESYKINLKTFECYQKFIKPWLESASIKDTGIGHAFTSIIENKIWYLIPSELKKLSADKIGSAVSSDLQQAALQDFKQVWINSLIFEKMNPTDQAVLMIHELLMGLRLLKLDSPLAECLAFQSTNAAKDPQYCHNNSAKETRGQPADLTQNDYSQIRSAAAHIVEVGPKLTIQELEQILGSQGFIQIAIKKIISPEQLSQKIEASKLMKTWPTYGFDLAKFITENQDRFSKLNNNESLTLKSDLNCDVDVSITENTISFSFTENDKRVTFGSKWTSLIEMHLNYDPLAGFSLYSADFPMLKSSPTVSKGDSVANVTLKFLGDTLMGIDLSKTTCLNNECSEAGQGINGYHILCYTRPSVTIGTSK